MNPLFSLEGKVALITGSSRGLGLGMASGLAAAGATVVLNASDAAALPEAVESLRAAGHKADSEAFDVTDIASMQAGIRAVAARHGRLDILLANAGTHGAAKLGEWTEEAWDRVMDCNLKGAFFAAQEAALIMMAQGSGTRGRPTIHGYSASKGAVGSIARTLANELGPHGITVNALAPGYFETELTTILRKDTEFVARMSARIPLRRWGQPQDLAGIAVFLASEAGAYITGQELYVDGGLANSI